MNSPLCLPRSAPTQSNQSRKIPTNQEPIDLKRRSTTGGGLPLATATTTTTTTPGANSQAINFLYARRGTNGPQTKQFLVDQFFDPTSSKKNSLQVENQRLRDQTTTAACHTCSDDKAGSFARKLKGFEFLLANPNSDIETDINKQNHQICKEIAQLENYVKGDLKHSIEINDFQYQENEKRFNNTMKEIAELKYKIRQYVAQIRQNTEKLLHDRAMNKFYKEVGNGNSSSIPSQVAERELNKFEKMMNRLDDHEETLAKSNNDLKLIKSRLKSLDVKLQRYERIQVKKYEKLKFYKKCFIVATLVCIIFMIYRNS